MEIVSREVIQWQPAVTVERVKANIRLTDNSFDDIIQEYISSAIATSEQVTGVVINASTFTIVGYYEGAYRLPIAPIIDIEVECDGVAVDYELNGGVLILPSDYIGKRVTITAHAGYSEVPADIRMAIILKASALFLNPVDGADTYVKASDNLLKNYRVWR